MSLLQVIVGIASVIFLLFGIDRYKRKKATALHAIIFIGGGFFVLIIAIWPALLDRIGSLFGTARGADIFVYATIFFLAYFYIEMFNAQTKDKQQLTKLITTIAVQNGYEKNKEKIQRRKNTSPKDDFLFHIRTYNEAQEIGNTIETILAQGYKKILFIDDGSRDATVDIIHQKEQQHPDCLFILLRHTINRGPGAPNQTGFTFVQQYTDILQSKRIVMYDADGQMDIHDMKKFEKITALGTSQVIFGSRFLGIKAKNMSRSRKILLRLNSWVSKCLYGIFVTDHHCGYRVVSVEAVQHIHIQSDGRNYPNDMIEQIYQKKIPFAEIPVHIMYTTYSTGKKTAQKPINSIKIGLEMLYKKFFYR